MGGFFLGLLLPCVLKSAGNWLDAFGSGKWLSVDAAVTPIRRASTDPAAVRWRSSIPIRSMAYSTPAHTKSPSGIARKLTT